MENRLCLNKRPVYELPDNTQVQIYQRSDTVKRLNMRPRFEPDVCVKVWSNYIKTEDKCVSDNQIWIKTDNKDLIDFLKRYKSINQSISTQSFNVWKIKKIILEEFYNKQSKGCDIDEENYR